MRNVFFISLVRYHSSLRRWISDDCVLSVDISLLKSIHNSIVISFHANLMTLPADEINYWYKLLLERVRQFRMPEPWRNQFKLGWTDWLSEPRGNLSERPSYKDINHLANKGQPLFSIPPSRLEGLIACFILRAYVAHPSRLLLC